MCLLYICILVHIQGGRTLGSCHNDLDGSFRWCNSRISFDSKRLVSSPSSFSVVYFLPFWSSSVIHERNRSVSTARTPHRTITHLPSGKSSTERSTQCNFVCLFDPTNEYFACPSEVHSSILPFRCPYHPFGSNSRARVGLFFDCREKGNTSSGNR